MVDRKQCVHRYNVFDFLREIVNKVPDMGGSDAATGEERNGGRRRKAQEGLHLEQFSMVYQHLYLVSMHSLLQLWPQNHM